MALSYGRPPDMPISIDELRTNIRSLKDKFKETEEEGNRSREEIHRLNETIGLLNDRERRLEELILELSFELGGQGSAPPRPKEYSVTPEQAIDAYIQIASDTLQRDTRVWQLKYEAISKETENLKATGKPPPPPPGPKVEAGVQTEPPKKAKPKKEAPKEDKAPAKQPAGLSDLYDEILGEEPAELKSLRAKVDEKKQKVKELKAKQRETVEKAQKKIKDRDFKISAYEQFLTENGIELPSYEGTAPEKEEAKAKEEAKEEEAGKEAAAKKKDKAKAKAKAKKKEKAAEEA